MLQCHIVRSHFVLQKGMHTHLDNVSHDALGRCFSNGMRTCSKSDVSRHGHIRQTPASCYDECPRRAVIEGPELGIPAIGNNNENGM